MIQAWPVALTVIGATAVYLGGRNFRTGWAIGFLGQWLWAWYAFGTEQWGFLGWAGIFGFIYARHWLRWGKEDEDCCCKKSCRDFPSEVEELQLDGVG